VTDVDIVFDHFKDLDEEYFMIDSSFLISVIFIVRMNSHMATLILLTEPSLSFAF
jgi:hypothetical protein